jgi:hypothetical protein
VPALRGGSGVLRIDYRLKTFSKNFFVEGEDTILTKRQYVRSISLRRHVTYRSLSNKIGDRYEDTSVSIDESLEPGSSLVIADLDNMN